MNPISNNSVIIYNKPNNSKSTNNSQNWCIKNVKLSERKKRKKRKKTTK